MYTKSSEEKAAKNPQAPQPTVTPNDAGGKDTTPEQKPKGDKDVK